MEGKERPSHTTVWGAGGLYPGAIVWRLREQSVSSTILFVPVFSLRISICLFFLTSTLNRWRGRLHFDCSLFLFVWFPFYKKHCVLPPWQLNMGLNTHSPPRSVSPTPLHVFPQVSGPSFTVVDNPYPIGHKYCEQGEINSKDSGSLPFSLCIEWNQITWKYWKMLEIKLSYKVCVWLA